MPLRILLDKKNCQCSTTSVLDIETVEDPAAATALLDPLRARILSELTDVDLSNKAFPWLSGQEITVAGNPCYALRVSFAGELGWELHAPLEHIGALFDALFKAAEPLGLTDIGSYAFNGMRMEKAYRASGELTTDVGPLDVGLERFVVAEGRDFLGKEALLARDPGWELYYAELHADDIDVHGGEPVLLDGKPVGLTTSGGYGYTVGKSLGWLFVRKGTPKAGLQVQILNKTHDATVLEDAAFDPGNLRPRAED